MPLDPIILDETLRLAMAWGEFFEKPTQPRLVALHPELDAVTLDEYDAVARAAMRTGHDLVYQCVEHLGQDGARLYEDFKLRYLARHPWVSEDSAQGIFSQGRYYTWKDGVGS